MAPDLASGHIGLAKAYLAQFTPENPQWSAVNEAMQAVTLAPQDTAAKVVLARALALHGRFAQASELVQELQRLKPQDIEVFEIEAMVARGQGHSGEAAAASARAETVREGSARRRLAELQLDRGDTDQATKGLAEWLDMHPEDNETRKVLAEIYVNTGRLAEAHAQYLQLAAQEPKNPIIQNNLAWVLARLGRWQEALPYARSAAALEPGSVEFLDTLGAVLLQTGNPAEASSTLEMAWSKAADRPDIGYHFSQALAACGPEGGGAVGASSGSPRRGHNVRRTRSGAAAASAARRLRGASMCGIAGVGTDGGHAHALAAVARTMTDTLVHRGPDAGHIRLDPEWGGPPRSVTLYHRSVAGRRTADVSCAAGSSFLRRRSL